MAPFSFAKISGSASLDAPSIHPVSDAARATHESFASHLQRAGATAVEQPTRRPAQEDKPRQAAESRSDERVRNEPARNEPVRHAAGEAPNDDRDGRRTDETEATTSSGTPAERKDDEDDAEAASEIGIAATTAERLPNDISEIDAAASGDSDETPDDGPLRVPAAARADAPRGELDTSRATHSDEPTTAEADTPGDKHLADDKGKGAAGERVEPASTKGPARRVNPAEANEEAAAAELPEATPIAERTNPDDEPPRASSAPHRLGRRGDVSAKQPVHETPDAAPKAVAAEVVEAARDATSQDSPRQRRQHQEAEVSQPIGRATATESATTTPGTPSRFAQHLLGRAEDAVARGSNMTNADQARFVDRVARAMQATGDHGGTLRLRLSPPELGSLTLEIKVQGGTVSARVEADTSAARSLLLEHLPVLRERLAEHGMRVEQFDVDLNDRQPGGTPDGLQQHDQQHEHRPRAKTAAAEADDGARTAPNETPNKDGNGQLNIII